MKFCPEAQTARRGKILQEKMFYFNLCHKVAQLRVMFVVKIVEGMKNSIASRKFAASKSIEDDVVNDGFGQPMPKDLLSAIEVIVDRSRGSELCDLFFEDLALPLGFLMERLQMTRNEALLLAVAVNLGVESSVSMTEFANYFECSRIKLICMTKDLESLVKRRYLVRESGFGGRDNYTLRKDALACLTSDKPYVHEQKSNLTTEQFYDELGTLIHKRKNEDMAFDIFREEVDGLFEANAHLTLPSQLKTYDLTPAERMFMIVACDMLVNNDDEMIVYGDYNDVLSGKIELKRLRSSLGSGKSNLINLGLVENINNNGFSDNSTVRLTDKARTELLSDTGVTVEKRDKNKKLIQPDTITAKELFYNPSEQQQIDRLQSLLKPEAFDDICARLSDKGFRKGFACLFYGAPGTGKTETVLQIARKTGRAIMQVNISDIKSKWVGESEKNIKAIFDRYRALVKSEPLAPILFFNEADAVINKRSENAAHSVDKMENAMQNIILQEMETMEGILIATTNLTKNIDRAFERRFIYKIEFGVPSLEAKRSIWLSMIPSLGDEDATTLATKYNFSGGQIENIARKHTVEQILSGEEPTLATLHKLCDVECLNDISPRRAIGF